MSSYTKYISTVGLNVVINERRVLAKVFFGKKKEGWEAWLESARNCAKIPGTKKISLTDEEVRELPENSFNEITFARAAFGLFGVTI